MGVKNIVRRIGDAAGNKVARLSSLSSGQVAQIQKAREDYLLQKPDPNDEQAKAMTWRFMASASVELFNSYLPQIKELYAPVQQGAEYETFEADGSTKAHPFNAAHNIRYINITKWVTDRKENSLEKLVNVYAVLSNEECNIALVFNRTQKGTKVYLAVVNTENAGNNVHADTYRNRLVEAIRGNFPGAEWTADDENEGRGVIPCLDNTKPYSVATATNVPTEKSEKFLSQTIEKLLDGIIPDSKRKEYTLVLLATPILDAENRKLRLGEFYSGMAPYASWQTNFTLNETESLGSSATIGVNVGASAGVQNGQNYARTNQNAETENTATTDSTQESLTKGSQTSHAESQTDSEGFSEASTMTNTMGQSDSLSTTDTTGTAATVTNSVGGGINAGMDFGPVKGGISLSGSHAVGNSTSASTANTVGQTVSKSFAESLGKTASKMLAKGISNTISQSVATTTGTAVANTVGRAVTRGLATTSGLSSGANFGANVGANFARTSTVTAQIGKNEGITQSFVNYNVKHALELLESQMKRYEQSSALGMWDFAAYVLSEDSDVASNVAHTYLALTQGEESYLATSAVNLWKGNVEEEAEAAAEIAGYIRHFRHPMFALKPDLMEIDMAYNIYPSVITATTGLSGKELAYSLNFPQRAIAGLPILECAEFGRNVVSFEEVPKDAPMLKLGKIFHMNRPETTEVSLAANSLASHTFVTGSTGSGKSNTIYRILEKARKQGVRFMVVESAKGEYKHVFGDYKSVTVYGTNPKKSRLLRLNPFSFPEDIHVLEHLDRLVEIFNVCWPMYAAMPAVLKKAVEKSYEDCGWDLQLSENRLDPRFFPSFRDVAKNIRQIIDNSEYDTDNKGAYKGSLLTRLESLCNGLSGMIFVADELADEELFDENVIIDLSRVGSSETKSLIMGMLVLKLQEHRMAAAEGMNAELKHLTVLEEAHNLLRKPERVAEGGNLAGKSVEMLANAIAEMRTYGEGFIIADQAPGLLDPSAIRNTNTKIIMRLPDKADRELVGQAANLSEEQIKELAKLPCGVAAIYQNEWVQPILCKVEHHPGGGKPFRYVPSPDAFTGTTAAQVTKPLLDFIMNKSLLRKDESRDAAKLRKLVIISGLDAVIKRDFLQYLAASGEAAVDALRQLVFHFLSAEQAIEAARSCDEIKTWARTVVEGLTPSIKEFSRLQINLALALILHEQATRDAAYDGHLIRFAEVYQAEGGVF